MSRIFALVLVVFLVASSLFMVMPAKAQVENVTTSCYIIANNIVEGQPVAAVIQISPAPPDGEVFSNISVQLISPMQGVYGNGGNGPWSKNDIITDTDGKANVTFDIATFSGFWNIEVYFLGQYFANNTLYYQPSYWQTGFTVSPANTPLPSITTSPTFLPTPSVPEFTVSLVDHSYTSPPTVYSKTDPYTNETATLTAPGSFVANFTLDIKIKNQQYPLTIGGNSSNLYYNLRTKGFYEENWTRCYSYSYESPDNLIAQSNSSEYTVISIPTHYRVGDLVDVQVEAILGYSYSYPREQGHIFHLFPEFVTIFNYERSGWSPTQTYTMPDLGYGSPSPAFPSISGDLMLWTVSVIAVVALAAIVLLLLYVRRLKRSIPKN